MKYHNFLVCRLVATCLALFASASALGAENINAFFVDKNGTFSYNDTTTISPWSGNLLGSGKSQMFTANRPDGYDVTNWLWCEGNSRPLNANQMSGLNSGTYVQISEDKLTCTISYEKDGNNALGVRLDYIPFTLSFAGNGGKGAMSPVDGLNIDSNLKLSACAFTRTGYRFNSWTNALGSHFADAASVTGADFWNANTWSFDAKLFAQWAAIAYQVVFDGNGATGGSMSGLDCAYDQPTALPANAFVKDGWAFVGWSRTPGGQKAFDDKASVYNLTDKADAVITLYALWEEMRLTVTFDANGDGATVSPESKDFYKGEKYADLPVPVRTGYGSTGWWTSQVGGTLITANSNVEQVGRQTLYAHWTNNQYVVTFDAKGGTVTPSSTVVTFDQYYSQLPTPTKVAAAFVGWFMTEAGDQEVTAETQVKTACDHTLYARWLEKKAYTVTFDQQGGTGGTNEVVVTFGETLPSVPVPSREGFLFDGYWDEVEGGGKQYYSKDGVGQSWDKEKASTLYAKWKPNSYTIAFDSNGATNWVKTQLMTWNDFSRRLASNEYAKVGYMFKGWAKDQSDALALKVTYQDGQLVERNMASLGETNTLWAVWNTNTYWIAFDANGGTGGAMSAQKFAYDVPQQLSANEYEPQEHCEFLGWSADKAATEPTYEDREQVVNLSAEDGKTNTLYAVWKYVPSDLSLALDCTNLYFDAVKQGPNSGYPKFEVDSKIEPHMGNSCLSATSNEIQKIIAKTKGLGGQLTFWWKGMYKEGDVWAGEKDNPAYLKVEYWAEDGEPMSAVYSSVKEMPWTEVTILIPKCANQSIVFVHLEDSETCWLDHVTWTPDEPTHPEPTDADKATISAAGAKDGKFTLSFESKADFDYNLLTNANLLIDSWGTMEKKVGTGKAITFEPEIVDGLPQLFYKVETVQRQD